MIHGKYLGQGEDLTEVKKIRNEVFSGTGYDMKEELDPMSVNVLADIDGDETAGDAAGKQGIREESTEENIQEKTDEKINVAAGRLVLDLDDDRFYVDNLCVLEEYRGKRYGEFVLRALAEKANQCRAEYIWAEVFDEKARGFFEKMFFEKFEDSLMRAELKNFKTCCHGE